MSPQRRRRIPVVGHWRLILEEDPYGAGPMPVQERRLLELRADGAAKAQNYVEQLEGRWRRDGDTLTLGEAKVELVSVDAEQLVLIEDVPTIYLRGAPPRKVKNTYRRVSERELGPMLGRAPALSVPTPGSYAGSVRLPAAQVPDDGAHDQRVD